MLLAMAGMRRKRESPSRDADHVHLNLHQLQLFRVVADRGSLSLASRELAMRQPSLSIQMRRLEESFGLVLLRRSGRGVALTPAGKEVYGLAVHLLDQTDAAERRIEALRAGRAGSLRVGASHTGTMYFLVELVDGFSTAHPETQVDIEVGQMAKLLPKLHLGALDAVLNWGPKPPALTATTLFEDRFVVMCSPQHPAGKRGSLTADEFRQGPFIAPDDGVQTPSWMDLWLFQHDLFPEAVQRLPSVDAVKRFVEAGRGLTIMSMTSAKREVDAGVLVTVALKNFPLTRPMLLLTRPGEQLALTEHFRRFAQAFAAHAHACS